MDKEGLYRFGGIGVHIGSEFLHARVFRACDFYVMFNLLQNVILCKIFEIGSKLQKGPALILYHRALDWWKGA